MKSEDRFLEWLQRLPVSPPFPCNYLPEQLAHQQQFLWPDSLGIMPGSTYQLLMEHRFRRSGRLFYRPVCDACRSCIPIRLQVADFVQSKSQARSRKKNPDVTVRWALPRMDEQRLALYGRYTAKRHDKDTENLAEELRAFLYDSPTETVEASYWADNRLIAVGLCDLTPTALSSVYFYFDPAESARSLGVYSALVEMDHALASGRPYYYLGYWVPGCRKMDYKAGFGDHEILVDGVWQAKPRKLLF